MNEKALNPHGGDVYSASKMYGFSNDAFIDYSANINPLGVPLGLKESIISSLDKLTHYPDIECRALREAISRYIDVSIDSIIIGNGAIEIIFLLFEVLKPKKVLIPAPTFCEYAQAASRFGAQVCHFELKEEDGFKINVDDLIREMGEDIDALFLCNPNNPTSTLISREELHLLIEYAKIKNKYIIIDEAFIELTEGANANSVVDYVATNPNVFVIRAFTKLFAIPGLRLGYGIGSPALINKLWERKLPWSVNSLAMCIETFLPISEEYLGKTAQWINEEKLWFYNELSKLEDIKVFTPESIFILIKLLDDRLTSGSLKEAMASKGILIRDASNFEFLNNKFIRVAIKDREKNLYFLDLFRHALTGLKGG